MSTPSGRRKEGDCRLLARFARGEVRAVRAFISEHAARAMAVATRIVRDRCDAEDVVQETFIELWQRAGDFDPERGSPAGWVATIARSRAIDRVRVDARAGRLLAAARVDLEPAAAPTPDELEDQRRDILRIHRALDGLPPPQRAAIYMAYFDGLSQLEVARRTGVPLGTAKIRRQAAMANLSRLVRRSRRVSAFRPRSSAAPAITPRRTAGPERCR